MLMNIAKVFDKEQTCGKDNCSINLLRRECLKHFGPRDASVLAIDEAVAQYGQIMPSYIRNKKLAHFDLVELLSLTQIHIPFSKLEHITSLLIRIITIIFSNMGVDYSLSLADITLRLKQELKKLTPSL